MTPRCMDLSTGMSPDMKRAGSGSSTGESTVQYRNDVWFKSHPLPIFQTESLPTSKSFRMRMAASFEFAPGSDRILCERPYFDAWQVVAQLGLG